MENNGHLLGGLHFLGKTLTESSATLRSDSLMRWASSQFDAILQNGQMSVLLSDTCRFFNSSVCLYAHNRHYADLISMFARASRQSFGPRVSILEKVKNHSSIKVNRALISIICDRGLTHEIVRHDANFSQESTRYIDYSMNSFIVPLWCEHLRARGVWCTDHYNEEFQANRLVAFPKHLPDAEKAFIVCCFYSHIFYQTFRLQRPPEDARGALCHWRAAHILIDADMSQWQRMLKGRQSEAAHPDIRAIFDTIYNMLHEKMPELF